MTSRVNVFAENRASNVFNRERRPRPCYCYLLVYYVIERIRLNERRIRFLFATFPTFATCFLRILWIFSPNFPDPPRETFRRFGQFLQRHFYASPKQQIRMYGPIFFVSILGAFREIAAASQHINKDLTNHYNARFHVYEEPYSIDFTYHNYEQMSRFLRTTSLRFQNLTALYSIGKSVKGRDLWVMVVSSSPYEHMIGKPDVKYVANIHGNEAVGRELMLHLIYFFVTNYGSDPYITWLLDNTRIHILPSMNPDGFEVSKEGYCEGGQGRYNARGFDLNRNFPDYFKQNNKKSQPETEAVREWVSKIQFVLSGSLHGGALVASYPFDNTPNSLFQSYTSAPSISPDDDVFQHLSLVYSRNHGSMYQGLPCSPSQPGFKNGITNGAQWYPLTGGMQDFNYVWNGCMEITLELSCCKYPPASDLQFYWEENRVALIRFLAEAHRGVRGFVIDENGNPIERASIKVKSRDVSFLTTKYGEFWRILLPGMYKLEVYANGYLPREVEFRVVEQHPTSFNVTLYRASRHPIEDETGSNFYNGNRDHINRDHVIHFRPHSGTNTASEANSGIFSSLSNGFNSFVNNWFG